MRAAKFAIFVWMLAAILCACRRWPSGGAIDPGNGNSAHLAGSIAGTVRFVGDPVPRSTIVPVSKDRKACGVSKSKKDRVVDPASRGVRYVLLWLDGPKLSALETRKPAILVLDNRDCSFEPHAAVLTTGDVLEIVNHDKVRHTAHAYFGEKFNLLVPKSGRAVTRTITVPGLTMIRCDIHGWMNAFIRVDRHPYHAVTDAQGRFTIEHVPQGTYTLKAWHEAFGSQSRRVSVDAGATVTVELRYEQ